MTALEVHEVLELALLIYSICELIVIVAVVHFLLQN